MKLATFVPIPIATPNTSFFSATAFHSRKSSYNIPLFQWCVNIVGRNDQVGVRDDSGVFLPFGYNSVFFCAFCYEKTVVEPDRSPVLKALPSIESSLLAETNPSPPERMEIETPGKSDDDMSTGFVSDGSIDVDRDNYAVQTDDEFIHTPSGNDDDDEDYCLSSSSSSDSASDFRVLRRSARIAKRQQKTTSPKKVRPRKQKRLKTAKKTKFTSDVNIDTDVVTAAKLALKEIPLPLLNVKPPPKDKIEVFDLGRQRVSGARGYMGSPYKKYQCNVLSCSAHKKPFGNEKSYITHMKKHKKKYPRKCSVCSAN